MHITFKIGGVSGLSTEHFSNVLVGDEAVELIESGAAQSKDCRAIYRSNTTQSPGDNSPRLNENLT
jgi:hypothetical protein